MIRRLLHRMISSPFASEEERIYSLLYARGFRPDCILDVGAYEGKWSATARLIFGNVPTLMVDAQAVKQAILKERCRGSDNWTVELALLGEEEGREVTFFEMETGSSIMPERSNVSRVEKRMKTTTLDRLAAKISGDNLFLKIDVQGAELKVLAGANETLRRCGLVQLETAILNYNEGAPTLREVVTYMEKRGFAPVDIAGQIRINNILIQIDMLFAPHESPLRPDYFKWEDDKD